LSPVQVVCVMAARTIVMLPPESVGAVAVRSVLLAWDSCAGVTGRCVDAEGW